MTTLLEARDISVRFGASPFRPGNLAVDSADLEIADGECLSLVGESGSGKTTFARSIVGLQKPSGGAIVLDGKDLGALGRRPKEARRSIQMVFQDPRSSLNPRMDVRAIILEAWRAHPEVDPGRDREKRLSVVLDEVGLDPSLADRRPAALSGGQCQRVSIARALALRPRLVVCDEAVSALDVSVQAQILRLLQRLREDLGLTLLFISHDLGVVRQISDRISVMKSGQIVETGATEAVFTKPQHEYTKTLLAAALDMVSSTPSPHTEEPLSHE